MTPGDDDASRDEREGSARDDDIERPIPDAAGPSRFAPPGSSRRRPAPQSDPDATQEFAPFVRPRAAAPTGDPDATQQMPRPASPFDPDATQQVRRPTPVDPDATQEVPRVAPPAAGSGASTDELTVEPRSDPFAPGTTAWSLLPQVRPPTGPTGVDALFGDQQFKDHDDQPLLSRRQARAAAGVEPGLSATGAMHGLAPTPVPPPGAGAATRHGPHRALVWVLASLGLVAMIVGAFAIGRSDPTLVGFAVPTATPTVAPTIETPDPAPVTGPVEPGEYVWDELGGGECVDPFTSPWQAEFAVVDCDEEHAAQLVGLFELDGDAWPGLDALQQQANLQCAAPEVIDYAAAAAFDDVQLEAAYPVSEEAWAEGDRAFSCFVMRESGEPIVGTLQTAAD